MGFWNKRINNKNASKIASKMGVSEEKIMELKNGERKISGKTMEKMLNTIEEIQSADSKVQSAIENYEIIKWFQENNIKELRIKFGYKTQKELADQINVSSSIISLIEAGKYNIDVVTPIIEKIYNFFNNEFNIKKQSKVINKEKQVENKLCKYDEIMAWYKNTDIKALREEYGFKSQKEFAKYINSSQSMVCDCENKRFKDMNKTILKLYEYYNNCKVVHEIDENAIWNWYLNTDLRTLRKEKGYTLNKLMLLINVSYDQLRDFESHNYRKYNNTIQRFYDFYSNPDNKKYATVEKEKNVKEVINSESVVEPTSEVIVEDTNNTDFISEKDIIKSVLLDSLKRLNGLETQNEIERSVAIVQTVQTIKTFD
jgi:transcriptional regulator with XRE-family HTH domain